MDLLDLTDEAAGWLSGGSPARAFQAWIERAPECVAMAFSGLGAKPGSRDWERLVRGQFSHAPEPVLRLLRHGEWRRFVTLAMDRAWRLVGDAAESVAVVTLVGLGRRNAAPGYWRKRGFAFLFLEHFLPSGSRSPWLDLGAAAIPVWLAHEIGHAVRYCAPGTASSVPAAAERGDCWSFWDRVESLPLAERFLDEGLATAFSRAVAPHASDEAILGMTSEALRWLADHGDELLRQRLTKWDLTRDEPPLEWVRDALWDDPERREPPWSLDRPPARWGYFVGERHFARDCGGDWPRKLGQRCGWVNRRGAAGDRTGGE